MCHLNNRSACWTRGRRYVTSREVLLSILYLQLELISLRLDEQSSSRDAGRSDGRFNITHPRGCLGTGKQDVSIYLRGSIRSPSPTIKSSGRRMSKSSYHVLCLDCSLTHDLPTAHYLHAAAIWLTATVAGQSRRYTASRLPFGWLTRVKTPRNKQLTLNTRYCRFLESA